MVTSVSKTIDDYVKDVNQGRSDLSAVFTMSLCAFKRKKVNVHEFAI